MKLIAVALVLFGLLHESAWTHVPAEWQMQRDVRDVTQWGLILVMAWFIHLFARHRAVSAACAALAVMRSAHPALQELDWATIYQRPDLQLRAVILKSRSDWMRMPDAHSRMEFTDLAYNAGRGRVAQDRRACGLVKGCDPNLWHGHVEHTCTASRAALYGTRSACDISRHHVHDVFARAPKYGPYLGEL